MVKRYIQSTLEKIISPLTCALSLIAIVNFSTKLSTIALQFIQHLRATLPSQLLTSTIVFLSFRI